MGTIFNPPLNFDPPLAKEAAALVQNAYAQYKQGPAWHIQPGYDQLALLHATPDKWLAKDEMFGFVARNQTSGDVFVTFRGTESAEDWLSNITFPQVRHPWGMVEEGFFHLYEQCSNDIKQAVAGARAPRVFVTGHSLGAALATLATADLTLAGTPAAMYNFASPRVGNLEFAKQFDYKVPVRWRVVNTEDIVTTVPLATLELEATKMNALHIIFRTASILNRLDFEHAGVPVCFTTHNSSVIGNHEMDTYEAALP